MGPPGLCEKGFISVGHWLIDDVVRHLCAVDVIGLRHLLVPAAAATPTGSKTEAELRLAAVSAVLEARRELLLHTKGSQGSYLPGNQETMYTSTTK